MATVPGQTGRKLRFMGHVDQHETYGAHVVRELLDMATPFGSVLDIGAGPGRDLSIARSLEPKCTTLAIDGRPPDGLRVVADKIIEADIERARLPFEDSSLDVVIANQVLEHTKEIYWIFSEISRVLRIGGHFLFGVPNVVSMHNRALVLIGHHPTQHKLYSAHVRVFSRRDTESFLDVCWPGGYRIVAFRGSQFYPFPRPVARQLSAWFPSAAFSIFWLLRKAQDYGGQFLAHPGRAKLETPFYVG